MNQRGIRIPVTKLKEYLADVGIAVTTLADLAGINPIHLHKCLSGEVDGRNGTVRTMSAGNVERLQDALHEMSLKLKYLFILYNDDLEVVKQGGRRYCPDCVEQIRTQLSPLVSVLPFLQTALGWNRSKVRNVMDKKSIVYGNITRDDVDRINLKLAETATRLDLLILSRT